MRNENLAYDDYGYRGNHEAVTSITNKRTSGGVMIKTGSKQTRKVNTNPTTRRRVKTKINRGTLLSIVVLTAMAFAVLFRGLMLTSGYDKLEEKNALLSETLLENQKRQFKIDQALDLKNIESVAENTYNMRQPSKSQTIYINMDQTDEVKQVREENSFVENVKNFFGGIVEYFS